MVRDRDHGAEHYRVGALQLDGLGLLLKAIGG
jgi:hypothetical protein